MGCFPSFQGFPIGYSVGSVKYGTKVFVLMDLIHCKLIVNLGFTHAVDFCLNFFTHKQMCNSKLDVKLQKKKLHANPVCALTHWKLFLQIKLSCTAADLLMDSKMKSICSDIF